MELSRQSDRQQAGNKRLARVATASRDSMKLLARCGGWLSARAAQGSCPSAQRGGHSSKQEAPRR